MTTTGIDTRVAAVTLSHAPLDPQAVLAAVARRSAGGNVLFVGTVRDRTGGLATDRLDYEAHRDLAAATLAALCGEAAAEFDLAAVAVAHRLGLVEPGEASVAVATSAAHRRAAFAAAEWLMERIKREVPIWKCEHRPDGSREWVHGDTRPGGGA
jgi:molybdopterin synthase catalytic subunit